MTMQAVFNGVVIAESDDTVVVEGNHYFPRSSVQDMYIESSTTQTVCRWKGTASYYHVVVDGRMGADAAWYYPKTTRRARRIEGRVAFWKDVVVRATSGQDSNRGQQPLEAPEEATC